MLKELIKSFIKSTELAWKRLTTGYKISTFKSKIRSLGLGTGDIVIAHIGMKHFRGFHGTPDDVIDAIQDIIGPNGTLLMPSMPFLTAAVDYAKSGMITDIRNTPSAMGVVTELFRLRPGTLRSVHPTHPILAQGSQAKTMLSEHIKAKTPCGKHSPFEKLYQYDGKVLILGSGLGTNTFYHFLEEVFEDKLPGPLTNAIFEIKVIDDKGVGHSVPTRLYDKKMSRMRDPKLTALQKQLETDGTWREITIGNLQVILLGAKDVYNAMSTLVDKGIHCYTREIDN